MLKSKPPIFLPPNISVKFINKLILLKSDSTLFSSVRSDVLSTSKLKSQLVGQSINYCFRLHFIGVGYRVESIENKVIKIKLGFSHFIFVKVPSEIITASPKKTSLILRSSNFFVLKSFLSEICQIHRVDPYKGKGIRLKNQFISLKEGKKK